MRPGEGPEGLDPAELAKLIALCKTVNWTADTLAANGITIHYYHSAPPAPLPKLLFIHGLTDAAGCCLLALSGLAEKYHVFVADNRGHGLTQQCPRGSFTVADMAADSLALIGHISPDEPLLVIGHSMGGAISAHVTKQRPDLVKALVMEDPPWRTLEGQSGSGDPGPPPPPGGAGHGMAGGGGRGGGQPGGGRGPLRGGGPFNDARNLQSLSEEEFAKMDEEAGAGDLPPLVHTRLWSRRQLDVDLIEPSFKAGTGADISEAVEGLAVPVLLQTASHIYPDVAKQVLAGYPKAREIHYPGEGLHIIHEPPNLDKWLVDVLSFFDSIA